MANRKGRSLERLVAALENALGDGMPVTVESPKRLPDRTTGRLREHDVVLTMEQGHHSLMVAIECRDRSRPVGVPQVEAFNAKCLDTGISKGVMVSPTGFYETARQKANHLGVQCLDFAEAASFDWLLAHGIANVSHAMPANSWKFAPETEGVITRKETLQVIAPDGTQVSAQTLTNNAYRILRECGPQVQTETTKKRFKVRTDGFQLRDSETGKMTPAKFATVDITYSINCELVPFKLKQYRDESKEGSIADVAIAELQNCSSAA